MDNTVGIGASTVSTGASAISTITVSTSVSTLNTSAGASLHWRIILLLVCPLALLLFGSAHCHCKLAAGRSQSFYTWPEHCSHNGRCASKNSLLDHFKHTAGARSPSVAIKATSVLLLLYTSPWQNIPIWLWDLSWIEASLNDNFKYKKLNRWSGGGERGGQIR